MRHWLRGQRGGLAAFLAIAALVAGGLGWVTAAALRLEAERIEARARAQAEAQHYDKLRLALWSLDSWMYHVLGREESRPYNHYSAVYALSLALQNDGNLYPPGSVLELSPLLSTELPDWMLLHFQVDQESGWGSPQVLSRTLRQRLANVAARTPLVNATAQREQTLAELARQLPPARLLSHPQLAGAQPTFRDNIMVWASKALEKNEAILNPGPGEPAAQQQLMLQDLANRAGYNYRRGFKDNPVQEQIDDLRLAFGNTFHNGEGWFSRAQLRNWCSAQSSITLSPMLPLWLTAADGRELLVVARRVRIDEKQVCQGILLDWPRLQKLLTAEVNSLFPAARIEPMREPTPPHPERTMTALPLQLDPGPLVCEIPEPGWTPLRIGLALAWAAALVALAAVGLGGWSLIDLSERRIRFVSAVTHELRTPLTTLRLYLDMLTGGLVRDEKQKEEYLHTLNAEAERLNRLVGNVLDFSRLENQTPQLTIGPVAVADLLEQVRSTWQGRCQDAGKELIVENALGEAVIATDVGLVQQILANLIDNACKYSRSAADRRVWLRARANGSRRWVVEVEDRGPGVAPRERRSIFRPFRRGRDADVTAGGVGLGLALAQRWAALLGGRLTLLPGSAGACFRLELPFQSKG
ncbi:MAG TPA: HAMP domain-containing sensor histidine kinase [Gemmataceae bacterium]|nr:HAMP domain-containing sensor histidine kinase [Gemmataceae bacterium]